MAEPEPDQGFQVRDRRRAGGESEADSAPRLIGSPSTARPVDPATPAPGPRELPANPPGDERNLVGLFEMLGSLAMAALEGMPDPATGQLRQDPAQAAELIDVLLLLRERTEGRRTLEEGEALDEIIYELQLGYVRATTRR